MIATIIGLASTAITGGIKKANAKTADITAGIAEKKLEELTSLGLVPGAVDNQQSVAEIVPDEPNLLLIGAALIAALFLIKS